MTAISYIDELGSSFDVDNDIYSALDEITAMLSAMTKEQRIAWFRRTQYPHPINFAKEIDGTVYTVKTCFNKEASESLEGKAQRIILKNL